MVEAAKEFIGTERFILRRRLGAGGMGVVYEAHDREMDKVVALKTLTRAEAAHIYRFKREFRTLADVSHPNLASLYELMSDGRHWFFTMELVNGVTFIQYVRPEAHDELNDVADNTLLGPRPRPAANTDTEAETVDFDSSHLTYKSGEMPPLDEASLLDSFYKLDEERLRSALRQLAEGVNRLHEVGKLHRDIKPSNVLVTEDGRVVILDFGLVEDIQPELHETLLAGTPDYMSPEQGAQMAISKASDWYSVGVILYQALTGRLPFKGRFFEVMSRKQTRDPIQPIEINREVPRDLNELCVKLLRRDPVARPTGREVLRALGTHTTGGVPRFVVPSMLEGAFIGREQQLAGLHEAFGATREGQTVAVYVHGNSGMGKTTLVRAFLDQLKQQAPNAMVLQGRCYERESVPYKALDGVVDNLSKKLASLRQARVEALMPRNSLALARVFPVMLQVDAIFNSRPARPETIDLFTLRRQAFGALRELLGRISGRQPLVIYIDDLQWADADSIFLLEDLLRPPDAPPLLLVGSFRTEDIEARPFLKQLLLQTGTDTYRELFVDPLGGGEARELARSLFSATGISMEPPFIESIVREAGGSPFLLEQLTQYAMMSERAARAGITLTTMLEERISQLPEGSRQFLDTLAVARRPVNQDVAVNAAGLHDDPLKLLSSLRTTQFVRSGGTGYGVELYHDRIGETLVSLLSDDERRQIHRRLAQAIEARGLDDPEGLYEDYLGAGEEDRAALHAQAAARKAASALAFDRAALYYRRAIELMPDAENVVDLKIELGNSLANAGRPAEAAREFLEAAKVSAPRRALDLQQRAGAQLLTGGHIAEGLEVFRVVLESAGFTLAKGPKRALLSLILHRLWLRLRGLGFTERDISSIPEGDLLRIDICWAVAAGLGVVDLIRGADFQSRHLLLALRAGEIYRVARAMAFEVGQTAAKGGATHERALELADRTEALARRAGNPHATGLAIWARGLSAYLIGHWKEASEFCERAAEVLRDQCTGVTWELTITYRFMLGALLWRGRMAEVSRRVPQLLSAALEQGNIFAATDLRTRMNTIWLADDDPDRARAEVISALTTWPREGFHLQHYTAMVALTQIELYTGDREIAWRHIEAQIKPMVRSMLLRFQVLRLEAMHLRARLALASADGSEQERRLRITEDLAQKLAKEKMAWSDPLAALLRAGVAKKRGDESKALILISQAIEGLELANMELYATAARLRLGEMIGGDHGAELIFAAEDWMRKQQIKNTAAFANMLAPGF